MNDPFQQCRRQDAVLNCQLDGERVPMILRHADVRAAAKDWQTLSSDAPFRVPIPSEEEVRKVRQLPIETDPPEQKEYRQIVEPFFKRAKLPEVKQQVESLIEELLLDAASRPSVEVVREFALPLQSRALTYLLNVPECEADRWIRWGTHVFRDGGEGEEKGAALDDYLHERFDQAREAPGEDFFSALIRARYQGRPLTREEMMGFANLTFAGGRDTIIHTVSSVLAYLARNRKALDFLREDPKRIVNATEEFFRVVTPLAHIGRVCPVATQVHGVPVKAQGRVSLCWASANRDESVFPAAEETRLDRKPNPHMAFGAGAHLCLGAAHARLLVRTLLAVVSGGGYRLEVRDATEQVEDVGGVERRVGYESLVMSVSQRY